jgi:Large polyvalent protein associated domain 38
MTYKFRLPPVVSTMFSDVPRRMMESIVEKDPHAWDRISSTLMESFAPPGSRTFAPSILTPAMEMALNHSFVSGRPLVSDSEMKMLPLARYRPYTTETAKSIGEFLGNTRLTRGLGISAIEIDHMIQGWGGNMGMSALKTVEGLVGGGKEEMKWSDLPIFNGIRSRYPSASAQPIQDFRDRMDKYDQVHNTLLHAMKENNLDQFKNVLHQYPEMSVMHKWQLSKDTKAQMPANAGDFFDALQTVAKSQKMDEESAGNALANQKALQNLSLISRMIHNNANGKLKPGEKSQMLDQTFLLMQKLGERGNQYLDKAGMK